LAFRPNWYENDPRRRGLGGLAEWTGFRWVFTLNVVVFIAQAVTARSQNVLDGPLGEAGAMRAWFPHESGFAIDPYTNTLLHGGFNWFFLPQLVTYAFLHAGLSHILFNMLYLWFFGPEVEAALGKRGFLRLYLGGAIFGGLLQWSWWLFRGEPTTVVGASGAVYTIMAFYALRWPHRQILLMFVIPIPIWLLMVGKVGSDIVDFMNPRYAGDTAVVVHLGGAVFGLLWYRAGTVFTAAVERRKRAKALKEFQEEAEDRREMDRILGKIQATGLASLDTRERAFLDRRSREAREARDRAP
jgi:membrane associated rhomboid family serine protease